MERKITLRALFMVFGLFLTMSLKASYICDGVVDNIVYQLYDDATARIHGCNKSAISGSLTIPDKITYNGATYDVTGIGRQAFKDCTGLTSVTISNSVTFINPSAFEGCTNLISVSIGSGLRDIAGNAFQGCTSLSSVIIPDGVENIDGGAFGHCTNLTSVTISSSVKSISQTSFLNCTSLEAFIVSEENQTYTSLEGILFTKDKTSLCLYPNAKSSEYTVSNSVTNIGYGAFRYCTGLKSITIPCGQIEDSAFLGCSELTSVTLGDKVTKIGFVAFYNCPKLKEVYSLNPTPPVSVDGELADFFSNETKENAVLYVSPGSIPAYKAADMWKGFKVIVEKGNESSITQYQNSTLKVYSLLGRVVIENAPEGGVVTISDLAGKIVYRGIEKEISLNSGIYIIKVGSSVQKVIVE